MSILCENTSPSVIWSGLIIVLPSSKRHTLFIIFRTVRYYALVRQPNLRVMFNALAKSRSGILLNDAIMVGPGIQSDLIDILIRFRQQTIVFSADITKMYRQIGVHEADTDTQRIVWRETVNNPIQEYRLKPSHMVQLQHRSLQQNA